MIILGYFSVVNPGVVKGWKLHKKMTCNLIVPIGTIKFVISKNLIDFDTFELGEKIILE